MRYALRRKDEGLIMIMQKGCTVRFGHFSGRRLDTHQSCDGKGRVFQFDKMNKGGVTKENRYRKFTILVSSNLPNALLILGTQRLNEWMDE